MSTVQSVQNVFVRAIRPMSGLKGVGRLCKLVNQVFLKAGVDPIQVAQMRDGTRMHLDLRSQTEWYGFYSGSYDDAAIALIRRLLLQLGGDFLDVGGNIGMYAIRVATALDVGRRIICVEPMPDNACRIWQNAQLNHLQDRVDVKQLALSDVDGDAYLVLREDFEMGSATGNASVAISDKVDGGFKKITVPMRRFDNILAELDERRFLLAKVDIEGHEDYFLRGAAKWMERDRPIMLFEINNWYYKKRGTTSAEVLGPALPERYETALLRVRGTVCSLDPCSVESLASLQRVETCLIYPGERRQDVWQAVS